MQPSQFNYPEFVPDQVLTSGNLNDMFNYLDEQDRLTRANLIGIGIVCGLEVSVNTAGTQITISGGCGITSGGYLVTYPETTLTEYKPYNALKPLYYEKFADSKNKVQYYKLDQLFESAVTGGTTPLTKAYLSDKVVMLYVELLEDNAKNCDPTSCDDKGKNIDITFMPLLISMADAAQLQTTNTGYSNTAFQTLPVLKLRRFNVPATLVQSSTQLFEEYRKILTTSFINNVQTSLSQVYNILLPLIKDIYPTDPFTTINADFAFINDNTLTSVELTNLQYYYDLFSDIEIAYGELRETGLEVFSLCCPDVNLFRLHLLLGEAIPVKKAKSAYRQYFIPSPVMECECKQTQTLRWLFLRIKLLLQNFYVSFSAQGNFGHLYQYEILRQRLQNTTIRITPSKLGDFPLAKKAIPFYYLPVDGTDHVVDNWDIEKTNVGEANQNLSYNSNQYATDDFVLNPLNYDLEPYNFLRIEGHIGMQNATALRSIINLRDTNRLPFEVVMLGTDLASLKTALAALGKTNTVADLIAKYAGQIKAPCLFQDLDAQYDTLLAEITCQLCKTMLYFYGISEPASPNNPPAALSVVPLVLKCNPAFFVQPATFGYSFEQFYTQYNGGGGVGYLYERMAAFDRKETNINIYYFLLLYIEDLYETLTPLLGNFDNNAFLLAYKKLIRVARDIIGNLSGQTGSDPTSVETLNQLERLVSICIQRPLEALYRDYLLRWVYVMMLQKFGYFVRKHPGIQHKAGVPMGGTFIMVYHESPPPTAVGIPVLVHGNSNIDVAVSQNFAKTNLNVQDAKAVVTGVALQADIYHYVTPAKNSAAMTDINDATIFQTEIPKQFNDLGILLQNIDDAPSSLASVIPDIPDGTVIADFYLPYLCCSDCPPIQYTVTEVLQPLTIAITPAVFCSADTATYNIKVTPVGGDVTGEGASKDATGNFIFSPAVVKFANLNDKQKDITLSYEAFGQSITAKVTVYQKPVANFDAAAVDGADSATLVNNSSVYADKYLWDFGDNTTSSVKDPLTHDYGADGTYTISLLVSNNICTSDKLTKTVTVKTPDITISMSKIAFCSDDKTAYQITNLPVGSTVTGEGVISPNAGIFEFVPAIVAMGGNANKAVTLTNTMGAKSNTLSVTVYQVPVANFIPAVQDGVVTFNNQSSAFATEYIWDFGDGSGTSNAAAPAPHTYTADGDYQVSLTVFNSANCSDKKTVGVTITLPKATIDIKPRIFCINDQADYPVILDPQGGQVTGEGSSGSANVYKFSPHLIAMNNLSQKPVTLTNQLGASSATVNVTVYQVPAVNFTFQQGSAPLSISFTNNTANADKYTWSFDTQGTSTEINPTFTFSTAGVINVTLTATNGDVCKNSVTLPVTINQIVTTAKINCMPVGNAVKLFNGLKGVDPANFQAFVGAFKDQYSQMLAFFKAISGADNLDATAQINLFEKQNAAGLLTEWITALTRLFGQSDKFATITTYLIDALTELIEHIACFQPEDINKAKVDMSKPLDALGIFCTEFLRVTKAAGAEGAALFAGATAQFNNLTADLNTEVARIKADQEDTTKPAYLALLEKIIQVTQG